MDRDGQKQLQACTILHNQLSLPETIASSMFVIALIRPQAKSFHWISNQTMDI